MNWIELIALIAILIVVYFASSGGVSASDLESLKQRTDELFDEANAEAQRWREKAAAFAAELEKEEAERAQFPDFRKRFHETSEALLKLKDDYADRVADVANQTCRIKALTEELAAMEKKHTAVRDAAQLQSYEVDRLKARLHHSNQGLVSALQVAQRNQQAATNWDGLINTLRTMIHRNEEALNPLKTVPADPSAPDDRRQSP